MAVFTPVSLADVIPWAEQFPIGPVKSLEGIASGIENSNFFLNTDRGEFVLTPVRQQDIARRFRR